METKLTVRIDDRLVLRAKKRARARGTSLSRLIADLLSALEETRRARTIEPTPRVSALRGALRGPRRDAAGGAAEGGRP